MTSFVVTGAAGFIGKSLVQKLFDSGYAVVAIDLPGADWSATPIDPAVTIIEQDLSLIDVTWWNTLMTPGTDTIMGIWHLASVVGVDTVIANPETMIQDLNMNTVLASYLRQEAREILFSFTSTSEIYGEQELLFEDSSLIMQAPENNPRGIYATQKLAAEHLFLNCLPTNIKVKIFRLFSVTGPNQSLDFVVPKFVSQAIAGTDITLNGDGSQSRMFMHVDDLIQVMTNPLTFNCTQISWDSFMAGAIFVEDAGITYNTRIMNCGNPWNYVTMYQLAFTIIRLLGSSSQVVYDPNGPIGELKRIPQIENMINVTKPTISLETTIREIAEKIQPNVTLADFVITSGTYVVNGELTDITINGTSEPLAEIIATYTDGSLGATTADDLGAWSLVYSQPQIPDGYVRITATMNGNIYASGEVLIDATAV